MTWMPASTWTPPAATSSSPSSSSSRRSLAAWNGASPSWRTKPNRAAHRGCPASSPAPARNLRPPSSPGSPGPMAFPVDGWPPPTGWSTRWRAAPIAGPRCPAAGPIAPGRSSTCPGVPAHVTEHVFIALGLSPLPAQLPPPGGAGRGGLGEAALGGQPGQPDRHPAGGGEAAHPQHPMVSAHRPPSCASAWAPSSPPSIAWRNRPGPRCRASWSASAAAPWSTPMRPAGGRTAPTAMCGRSARPPTATSCGVAAASRWWMKSSATGSRGVLVCDFYAAYHPYDGPKQRCWAHLLRDIHDLQGLYPDDGQLAQWAEAGPRALR